MAMRIAFGGLFIQKPGHYGPFCNQCNAPIMYGKFRRSNGKCDKCSGFNVHDCRYENKDFIMHDPNIENCLSDCWLDSGVWYTELDNNMRGEHSPPFHFKILHCPYCGIDLKTLEK